MGPGQCPAAARLRSFCRRHGLFDSRVRFDPCGNLPRPARLSAGQVARRRDVWLLTAQKAGPGQYPAAYGSCSLYRRHGLFDSRFSVMQKAGPRRFAPGACLLHDPCGNRTHVTAVKGPCLNRLTNGPKIQGFAKTASSIPTTIADGPQVF